MDELWRTSLQRIQEQFQTAVTGGLQLKLCMIQSSGSGERAVGEVQAATTRRQSKSPRQTKSARAEAASNEFSWPPQRGFNELDVFANYSGASYKKQNKDDTLGFDRSHYYAGDPVSFQRYTSLARRAGHCLEGLPGVISTALWSSLPTRVRLAGEPFSLWTDAVVELALQGAPGSPLRAVKTAWNGGASIDLRDLERFRQLPTAQRKQVPKINQISDPPDRWFSAIDDLFIASVTAIDVLLRIPDAQDGQPSSEKQPDVILQGPGKEVIVRGKEKSALTAAQYASVQALLEAGDRGLSTKELDHNTGFTEARKALRSLANSDSDWQSVISFPGKRAGRFRIT